ncbi:hypothetical protein [Pontiella desulfatans]|nr:hypothetical protein [Pontiella desulfatans]
MKTIKLLAILPYLVITTIASELSEPDLSLNIRCNEGEVILAGNSNTNFEYFICSSSNLTEWCVLNEHKSPTNGLSEISITKPLSNQAFFKKTVASVKDIAFVTTGNADISTGAIRKDGYSLFVVSTDNSSGEALFTTPDGSGALIAYNENGLPETLTTDKYVFYFTNWRSDSADVYCISNGIVLETCYNVPVDEALIEQAQELTADIPQTMLTLASQQNSSNLDEFQKNLSIAGTAASTGICIVSTAATIGSWGTSSGITVPVAAVSCTSAVLDITALITENRWIGRASTVWSATTAFINPGGWATATASAIGFGNSLLGEYLNGATDARDAIEEIENNYGTEFKGITFPLGLASFADRVISYNPSYSGGATPTEPTSMNEQSAIGSPDHPGGISPGSVALGSGGRIVLKFTDNYLLGSDSSAPDLYIFEVGSNVEDTFVEISSNGSTWHSVGKVYGGTSSIDIDSYGFSSSNTFSYVRLTDDPNEGGNTGTCVGADIDAVGAISSTRRN